MKTKLLKKFVVIAMGLFGLILICININANAKGILDQNDLIIETRKLNQATCYSTYTPPGFFDFGKGTVIFRCGTCESVTASSFSDAGICYF